MATTAKGIPYPLGSDDNDAALWFQAMADWLDDVLGAKTTAQITALSGAARWTGRTVFDSDKGQLMVWDGAFWVIAGGAVGSVVWLAVNSTPDGHLLADGSAVSRTTYAKLFAKIGTAFGVGDGSTTFGIPSLKGRTVFGFDAAQTEFNAVGKTGGAKTVTLSTANLPSHSHSINHDHGSFNSGAAGTHAHDPAGGSSQSFASFPRVQSLSFQDFAFGNTGSVPVAPVGTPWLESAGTDTEPNHQHSVDVPNFTGTSGPTGSGTAFSILSPYITLQPYIKF